MIIYKIIQTGLDLTTPEQIFGANINKVANDILIGKYVGKCYKGCLIIGINKIIRISERYFSYTMDAIASISITFEISGIIYQEGEIIPDCRITHIEPSGIMYGESKYANIQLKKSEIIGASQEGSIIPISVKLSRYTINKTKISIFAVPLAPNYDPPIIYNISCGLSSDEINDLKNFIEKIEIMEKAVEKMTPNEKKSYERFSKLLYPFKQPKEISENKELSEFKIMDLNNAPELSAGLICRPLELDKKEKKIYYTPKIEDATDETLYNIITIMYNDYYKHIINLYELAKTYSTEESLKPNINMWKMYNILKRT